MSRRNDAPSVRIIGHTKYILEKRNLICEVCISSKPDTWFDFRARIKRLYYPKGKVFIMETVSDMTTHILETKIVSEKEAREFLDKHPEGIKESVYERYFGKPEEL